MTGFTRRDFLKISSRLAVLLGLGSTAVADLAQGLESLVAGQIPVAWIQAQSCSGCSVSFLNSTNPGPVDLLTRYISLVFHNTLSTATGDMFMNVVEKNIHTDNFLLVVEGSIPSLMPKACMMGGKPVEDIILTAARNAKAVIAIGTCASFGGIPSAENNPTGALSVSELLKRKNIDKPVINIPGCPSHPDWIVGTLVHVLKFGMPERDSMLRPKMFFSRLNHDNCPRYSDYEREKYAEKFSDNGCLFKLGCLGVRNYSDCSMRLWNSGINSCLRAGAPCIGCASDFFAKKKDFPFYRKNEGEPA
ncbi:MAG: hydrogenase small subunit [Proteobacteria bacterium]|nr:hydrogenase small subunit [Pseudomonadota bacterium]